MEKHNADERYLTIKILLGAAKSMFVFGVCDNSKISMWVIRLTNTENRAYKSISSFVLYVTLDNFS